MDTPILEALHTGAGAVLAGGPPARLLTYGDVPAEYRAAQEGCVLFDQTLRGELLVTGGEADQFLHRLLANGVRELEPGQGNANLLLSSKGKVLHTFDLLRGEDGLRLSTPPGEAAALRAALDMYHFTEDVAFEDTTERHAPLALCGPHAAELAGRVLGSEMPALDGARHACVAAEFEGGPVRVSALPVAGSPGLRLDAGPERAAQLWAALTAAGAKPTGAVVHDILRVEAGQAEPGVDVDDNVYPQEAGLERAFSLDKGCYIGQEVVAKIDTYGGLNKRLIALAVDHDDPVPRGTRLELEQDGEWRDLGVVTSWAYSFVLDTGVVLAYVKRKHQDEGTTFRLGDGPASARVVALPLRAGTLSSSS